MRWFRYALVCTPPERYELPVFVHAVSRWRWVLNRRLAIIQKDGFLRLAKWEIVELPHE